MSMQHREPLGAFIEARWTEVRDPYEGEPLSEDWRSRLESGDVQELGDVALTQYYRPGDHQGLGAAWVAIDEAADTRIEAALLGRAIGPESKPFDPGRMGS
jgi:hypothetical protein